MARSSSTMTPRSRRFVGLAVLLMMIGLTGFACAAARPPRDSPLFRGCRSKCEREGTRISSVLETNSSVYCECEKPPPEET